MRVSIIPFGSMVLILSFHAAQGAPNLEDSIALGREVERVDWIGGGPGQQSRAGRSPAQR